MTTLGPAIVDMKIFIYKFPCKIVNSGPNLNQGWGGGGGGGD